MTPLKRQCYSLGALVEHEKHKILKLTLPKRDFRASLPESQHPQIYVMKLLQRKGFLVNCRSHEEIHDFFLDPTDEEIKTYCSDLTEAVRSSDLRKLRSFMQEGKSLKCSNRFGESLLHLACRKQRLDVVDFLLNEANVSPTVRDDYGRTPLHDACWTATPNFPLVDMVLRKCPDLLFIKDKRGHSPLFYARQSDWGAWIRHLDGKIDDLVPSHSSLLIGQTEETVAG